MKFMSHEKHFRIWILKSKEDKEHWKKAIVLYHNVHLMNGIHNATFGTLLVPSVKLIWLLAFFISVFVVAKLRNVIGPLMFWVFVAHIVGLCIVILGGSFLMSLVYKKSTDFHISAWTQFGKISKADTLQPPLQRILKSLQILKSNVGSFYHMEDKAKLTLLDDIANGIASMLVTF